MKHVVFFKGKNNREQMIAHSEVLRKAKVFHTVMLQPDSCVLTFKNNIRGWEKLEV